MKGLVRRFLADEKGLETVEYAVIGALITMLTVAAVFALSGAVSDKFGDIKDVVNYDGGETATP